MPKRERASANEEENEKRADEAPRESGVRERGERPEASAEEARETLESARLELSENAAAESADFARDTAKDLAKIGKEYGEPVASEDAAEAAALTERATDASARFDREAKEAVRETGADRFRADVERVKTMEKDAAEAEAKLAELSAMKEFMNYPGGQRGVDSEKEYLSNRIAELRKGIDDLGEGYAELPVMEGLKTGEPANDNALPFDADRPAMVPPSPDEARENREIEGIRNLLTGLAPEVAARAIENYRNAPEGLYGGITSKGMTPDGTARFSFRDGTIMEVPPDGKRRTNRVDAPADERIPSLAETEAAAQEAEFAGSSLITLENDLPIMEDELTALRMAEQRPDVREKIDALTAAIDGTKKAIKRKNTPEGLRKEMDSLREHIAVAEADLNLAPEEERGMYADLIDKWSNDMQLLQERLRDSSPDSGPDTLPDGPDDAERMTLDDDPRMQGIVEEKSLDLLLDGYRGFAEKYAMSLGPDGTVLTRDGKSTGKEPSEFLTDGDKDVVRRQAREIFSYRYPAEKERYDRESGEGTKDDDSQKAA